MSFVREDHVMGIAENLTRQIFAQLRQVQLPNPFPRLTYREAMDRFGSDKPDLRFGLEIKHIDEVARASEFKVFHSVIESGVQVKAINAKGCNSFSRSQIDYLIAYSQGLGAKCLSWIKHTDKGLESNIVKFFPAQAQELLIAALESEPGDLLLFCADQPAMVARVLGGLRLELARRLDLLSAEQWQPLWITEFPLLERDEDEDRMVAIHHPFTSPMEEDVDLLTSDPLAARARAYDLVLNGNEIAGGSIRISQRSVQSQLFELLALTPEEASTKFGFLLEALEYGAPHMVALHSVLIA